MNWPMVRMLLQLLRLEASRLLRVHRKRVQLTLLLVFLHHAWKRLLLGKYARLLHYKITAEKPQLHYQRTSQNEQLLASCPAMTKDKYYAPWHLFNGHLQTIQLSRELPHAHPSIHYERQTLDLPDGGILSLDWALPPHATGSTVPRVSSLSNTTPTMLILPGLTGGSSEFYIRCVVHKMLSQGWQVVVMNARGCAATPLKTPQLFCCANTDDLRFVLAFLREKYDFVGHQTSLVALGFSMGSNVLVKYLGEEKDHAKRVVTAGISVGNPFDLVECSNHLKSTFFYRNTYDKALNGNLQALFFQKSNAHQVFQHDARISMDQIKAATTLEQFDEALTRRIFDYESVHAYYKDASSSTKIGLVQVPLLCLNAKDDPISTDKSLPYEQVNGNGNLILCVTRRGGHLAFYEESDGGQVGVWSARVIAQFAQSVWTNQQQQQQQQNDPAK